MLCGFTKSRNWDWKIRKIVMCIYKILLITTLCQYINIYICTKMYNKSNKYVRLSKNKQKISWDWLKNMMKLNDVTLLIVEPISSFTSLCLMTSLYFWRHYVFQMRAQISASYPCDPWVAGSSSPTRISSTRWRSEFRTSLSQTSRQDQRWPLSSKLTILLLR